MDKYCTVLHWEEYYITVQSQNMCWSISEWNWIETSHSHVTNCQISVFFSYNLYILIIMLLFNTIDDKAQRPTFLMRKLKKMYQNLKTTCFSRWNLYHLLRYAIKSWKRNSPGLCVFEPCSLDLFPIMISSQQSWLKCHLTVTVSAAPQTLPAGETLKVYASPVFSTRH